MAKINELRASKGLSQLEVHPELLALGRSWAGEMAKVDRISHNPNLANAVKADWQKLGENVGVGMTVDKLHQAGIPIMKCVPSTSLKSKHSKVSLRLQYGRTPEGAHKNAQLA